MSWTDADTIKKHLFGLDQQLTAYNDVAARFNESGQTLLPHRGLVNDSVTVKSMGELAPTAQIGVVLNGETWKDLDYDQLVPQEIVAASDDGLQTIYKLDKDYAFDPVAGRIRRITGGAISDGGSVTVYYRRYELKNRDEDYVLDEASGQLAVIVSGTLEPATTVYVDYQISAASGVDQLIEEAITEAEDKIVVRLKDEYDSESTDQGLATGAVELTLAIICRGLASQALSDGGTAAEGRARGWRELSEHYERAGWITLRPFLKNPVVRAPEKRTNQSWEWA